MWAEDTRRPTKETFRCFEFLDDDDGDQPSHHHHYHHRDEYTKHPKQTQKRRGESPQGNPDTHHSIGGTTPSRPTLGPHHTTGRGEATHHHATPQGRGREEPLGGEEGRPNRIICVRVRLGVFVCLIEGQCVYICIYKQQCSSNLRVILPVRAKDKLRLLHG